MPKYGLSLVRIFLYIERMVSVKYDSVHMRENTDQRKPVFRYILRSDQLQYNLIIMTALCFGIVKTIEVFHTK